jgi:hypothetical protein
MIQKFVPVRAVTYGAVLGSHYTWTRANGLIPRDAVWPLPVAILTAWLSLFISD